MTTVKPAVKKAIISTLIALGLFFVLLSIVDFSTGHSDIVAVLARLSWPALSMMLLLSLVNYFCRICRWHITSNYLQLAIPFKFTALTYITGFSMTTTPARVGEAIRLWPIESCYGYCYEKLTPLLVIDRVSDVNATLLLCFLGLGSVGGYYWLTALTTVIFLLLTLLLMKPGFLLALIELAYRVVGRWPRLFVKVRNIVSSSAVLMNSCCYAFALVLAIFGWFAECLAFHYMLHSFGVMISFRQAIFIFTFAMLVGGLTMLPGGLGGTEITMLGLLVLLGVSVDTATAATLLIRITTLWFAVMIGFIALPITATMVKKQGGWAS